MEVDILPLCDSVTEGTYRKMGQFQLTVQRIGSLKAEKGWWLGWLGDSH